MGTMPAVEVRNFKWMLCQKSTTASHEVEVLPKVDARHVCRAMDIDDLIPVNINPLVHQFNQFGPCDALHRLLWSRCVAMFVELDYLSQILVRMRSARVVDLRRGLVIFRQRWISSGRVFMINSPAQWKFLHTWIIWVIVKQHLVQIGWTNGPTEYWS